MPTRKVPGKAARRSTAPSPPATAEREFAAALRRMAKGLAAKLGNIFLPAAQRVGRTHVEDRTDASVTQTDYEPVPVKVARREASIAATKGKVAAEQAFSKEKLRAETERAARKVDAHSREEFRKLGINPKKEPILSILNAGWTRDVAQRMAGMGKEQVAKLEAILAGGSSRFADTMAKEIEEQLGVTQSRAEFIARDSVGTLNSKVTRARFESAGIAKYAWTTMHDDRVRPEHEELDGEIFDVDGPGSPDEGHPGDMPSCRCLQWPLPPPDAPLDDGEPTPEDDPG